MRCGASPLCQCAALARLPGGSHAGAPRRPSPHGVQRLRGVRAPFEQFMQQLDTLAAIKRQVMEDGEAAGVTEAEAAEAAADGDGAGASGEARVAAHVASEGGSAHVASEGSSTRRHNERVRHLILLCVHSHHRFCGPASIECVRQAFGNPPTTVVALPCCATFNPTKDIGRAPDETYEDLAIFSGTPHGRRAPSVRVRVLRVPLVGLARTHWAHTTASSLSVHCPALPCVPCALQRAARCWCGGGLGADRRAGQQGPLCDRNLGAIYDGS